MVWPNLRSLNLTFLKFVPLGALAGRCLHTSLCLPCKRLTNAENFSDQSNHEEDFSDASSLRLSSPGYNLHKMLATTGAIAKGQKLVCCHRAAPLCSVCFHLISCECRALVTTTSVVTFSQLAQLTVHT